MDTEQRIRTMQAWQEQTASYMKLMIEHVVSNADVAERGGDGYPLEQLRKIAGMEMTGGVTNYQKELKAALDEMDRKRNGRANK